MAGELGLQILRGSITFDPIASDIILKDGQLFYSKYNNKLYIGDGKSKIKNLRSIDMGLNLSNDTNLNTLIQSMEPGKEPNIAAGRSDVVFGRYNIGDSRTLNADGSVKSKGDSLFVAGVQNKNYGNRSAQFGSYNENHSLGSFQAGYNNKILGNTEYVTQFGNDNFTDKSLTTQLGSGNEAGRAGQFQFGNFSEGKNDTLLEIGNGRYYYKVNLANADDTVGKYYRDDETHKYVEITEDNKQEIWNKLSSNSKYAIYGRNNALEVNADGTANIEKQGTSENSIVIKKTLDNYKPINAYEGTKGLGFTITDTIERTCAVYSGTASSKDIVIPSYVFINGIQYSVTSIADAAFRLKTNINTIIIPDTITKIGNQAFDSCTSLSSINIPNSVTVIGSSIFYGCSKLKEVVIPDNVTKISALSGVERSLFHNCSSLTKVELGKGIRILPYQCFLNCTNLTDVVVKGKVHTIMNQLFSTNSTATIWTEEAQVSNLKKLFKNSDGTDKYVNLIIKPYRDLIGVNEVLNKSTSDSSSNSMGLYQHHVFFECFVKYPDGEWNSTDFIEFYPILQSAEALTLENFAERLSGTTSMGSYGFSDIAFISVSGNRITITERNNGMGIMDSYTLTVTEPDDEVYWTITDTAIEIGV